MLIMVQCQCILQILLFFLLCNLFQKFSLCCLHWVSEMQHKQTNGYQHTWRYESGTIVQQKWFDTSAIYICINTPNKNHTLLIATFAGKILDLYVVFLFWNISFLLPHLNANVRAAHKGISHTNPLSDILWATSLYGPKRPLLRS